MADFYLDHDASARTFQADLRGYGHQVVTTRAEGMFRATDAEQLLYAARRGWILVTRNGEHFGLIHEAWHTFADAWSLNPTPTHAGILAISQQPAVPWATVAAAMDQFVVSRPPGAFAGELHLWHTAIRQWERHPIP